MSPVLAYLASFGATILAAVVGSVASVKAATFYSKLRKPKWAPPAAVFGPVWTLLYLTIAIAGGIALSGAGPLLAITLLFISQLALNALWSWTFFRWESGAGSMATIVTLWILIAATTYAFGQVSWIAAVLMVPYLAWVTFAAALNWTVWRLNPGVL